MFSGKTTKLIHFARKAISEGKHIEVFYPEIDIRYKKDHIVSHNELSYPSKPLPLHVEIIPYVDCDAIFIDEVQFFQTGIMSAIEKLLQAGIDVVVGGLDKDYRAKPFGSVPALMAMADEVIELMAKCNICGKDATYTFRVNAKQDDETIVIGGTDLYEARCEQHYIKPE
jgi:thymidine kinase